jgi:hypothetical protein
MIAVRLLDKFRMMAVASPAYLAHHPAPATLEMYLVLNAVLDGIGIGYLTELVISPRVADGQLGDWCGNFSGAYLYYPSSPHVPGPLRAFIDFMRTQSDRLDAARLKKSVNKPIVSGLMGPT